ncbi:MAG: hypothetical protein PHD82_03350 [Candidatus Riflebacteria bacterium]|jgi:protein-tyrosine phosphatase|nr:hypothetical protein [Candidatus Riflebacteria bacterium]
MESIQLPGRCYWLLKNRLLAGSYPYNPGSDEPEDFLRRLLAAGISAFIDLTEEDELTHYQPLLAKLTDKPLFYRRFEIQDYSVTDLATMRSIVDCINEQLANERCVYLHCRGGVGRTGTVAACWLCSGGMDGEQALIELAKLFSASNAAKFTRSPETDEQRQMVISYSAALRE